MRRPATTYRLRIRGRRRAMADSRVVAAGCRRRDRGRRCRVAAVLSMGISRAARTPARCAPGGLDRGCIFARSILTFSVGQDQLALQVPMMRAWNFSGIRVLPLDLRRGGGFHRGDGAVVHAAAADAGRDGQMRAVADNPDPRARAAFARIGVAGTCGLWSARCVRSAAFCSAPSPSSHPSSGGNS